MPVYTNPASTTANELGLTRGAYFIAGLLELAAVALLLWFWVAVWQGFDVFGLIFSPERTRPTLMYEVLLPLGLIYY